MEEILAALVRALVNAPEFYRPELIEGENAVAFEFGDGELFFIEVQMP